MTKLLVLMTTTLECRLSLSNPVRTAFTARMASNGSFPLKERSLREANVSISSMNTQKNVSSSSSSIVSISSNILLTSLPLSPKNLLPNEWALISTNLLWG